MTCSLSVTNDVTRDVEISIATWQQYLICFRQQQQQQAAASGCDAR